MSASHLYIYEHDILILREPYRWNEIVVETKSLEVIQSERTDGRRVIQYPPSATSWRRGTKIGNGIGYPPCVMAGHFPLK